MPVARPTTGPLPEPSTVTGASVCRYALATDSAGLSHLPRPVLSSSRMEPADAVTLVRAIGPAPAGSGPNSPQNCVDALGSELVVVVVRTARADTEVVVRYSGCDAHGTDDGAEVRQLTGDVLRVVTTGPHAAGAYQQDVFDLMGR